MDIFQNFNSTNNKLVIDLYTHFGSSYINILNKNVNTGLNTFYNGNLITNEIVLILFVKKIILTQKSLIPNIMGWLSNLYN